MATTNDRGLDAALALQAAGVRIAAVADLRPDAGGGALAGARRGRRDRAPARHDRRPRRRPPERDRRGARARRRLGLRARGPRAHVRLRPDRRLGRRDAVDLAAPPGRREGALRRGDRPLRGRRAARHRRRRRLRRRPRRRRQRRALGPDRRRRGRARPGRRGRQEPGRARAGPRRAARPPAPSSYATPPAVARERGKRRQGVRRPRRGRDDEGHRARRLRGLRLDRALQALHDGDDGPVAGPLLAARLDPRARRPHGADARRGRHDDGAAAVGQRADGRARGPAVRARQALGDPRPPARAEGDREVGGRLAPRLRLRRPGGRGARRPRVRGRDRRLHARQAARPRARRAGSCSTACTRTGSPTSSRGASATA